MLKPDTTGDTGNCRSVGRTERPSTDRRTSAQHGRWIDRGYCVSARPCRCHPQRQGLPGFGRHHPQSVGAALRPVGRKLWKERKNGLPPIHPGEIIKEDILPSTGLSVTAAAKALGVPRQMLHDILEGRKPLSTVMCLKVSRLFGGTPQLWMRLQAAYDLKIVGSVANRAVRSFRVRPICAIDAHPPRRAGHLGGPQRLRHVISKHKRPAEPLGLGAVPRPARKFRKLLISDRELRNMTRQKNSWVSSGSGSLPSE